MNPKKKIANIGENKLIDLIEGIISLKTGKNLIRDDSFFFSLNSHQKYNRVVFNSDMLVSTTDVPPQMSFFHIGRKAVIMNISDLIVKGVKPMAIMVSLGLPKNLLIENFRQIIEGIVDASQKWNIEYLGGDLNQAKEIIVNPTVFGFQDQEKIIFRSGMEVGDLLVSTGKFGLTGVGFNILLKRKGKKKDYLKYSRAIKSVLEPDDIGEEAFALAENNVATSSIDSSDGLAKSLLDLMISNPNKGFEINYNEELWVAEAVEYSAEFKTNLEELIFNGGEEFIHLFTINPNNYETAKNLIRTKGGTLIKIGKVISDENVYLLKESKRVKLQNFGYQHFT